MWEAGKEGRGVRMGGGTGGGFRGRRSGRRGGCVVRGLWRRWRSWDRLAGCGDGAADRRALRIKCAWSAGEMLDAETGADCGSWAEVMEKREWGWATRVAGRSSADLWEVARVGVEGDEIVDGCAICAVWRPRRRCPWRWGDWYCARHAQRLEKKRVKVRAALGSGLSSLQGTRSLVRRRTDMTG